MKAFKPLIIKVKAKVEIITVNKQLPWEVRIINNRKRK